MKKYLAIIITAAAILAVSQAAQGADHCVRAGAAGSDTGVDWINAYTALPDVLVRGDTYYVAEGDYPQLRIDDDVNGNLWIYIKKATPSAHGPGTGWTDSYGDGQAVFPKILIRASSHVTTGGNIEIDGVTGSGTSGHGFCIRNSDDTVSLFHVQYYYFEGNSGNIILRHTEICHTNYILDDGADGVYINAASPDLHDFTFSHLYIHDVSRNGFTFTAGSNYLVEHCVLARNHNTAVTHAQGMQITNCHNVTVRYCWFEDIRGTAHIALIGTNVTASNMYVYRNIFFNNDGLTGMSQSFTTNSSDTTLDTFYFCHNTLVNIKVNPARVRMVGTVTNAHVYNNLWYNCDRADNTAIANAELLNNWFTTGTVISTGGYGEKNAQGDSSNPFVDYNKRNFALAEGSSPIDHGLLLEEPFDTDYIGTSVPQGSAWDIGAYEYVPAHYIRAGATAGGDGSSWDRAWQQLPAALERGHTYYLAGGTYASYSFDDPESGSQYITIKKATQTDHGTDTGWSSVYGSGQAVFYTPENLYSQITFKTGYYIFDGNGTHMIPSKNSDDYGFKIYSNTTTNWGGIVQVGVSGAPASNITIKYTHVYNTTNGSVNNGTVSVRLIASYGYVKLQNCYLQNSGKDGIQISGASHVLVERCYMERLGKLKAESPDYHGQTVQIFYGGDDIIFRWNIWEANEGQGLIQIAGINSPSERIRFYGSVVFVGYGQTTATPGFNGSGGIFGDAWRYNPISSIFVYNNSFINIGGEYGGVAGFPILTPGNDLYSFNNLFYNCRYTSHSGWTEYGYHASGGGDVAGGSNEQISLTSGIFQDYTNNDFRLAAHTDSGLELTSQSWWNGKEDDFFGYLDSNLDMYGNIRETAEGIWDRGAYQYSGGFLAGDVSGDGAVTAYDAALALQLGKTGLEAGQIALQAVAL